MAKRKTAERGYGGPHQLERRRVAKLVAAGLAICPRCGQLVRPGDEWDLDHRDDRQGYLGASHRACNRATRAIAAKRRKRGGRKRGPPAVTIQHRTSEELAEMVPRGHVRCGRCGCLLIPSEPFMIAENGPQHEPGHPHCELVYQPGEPPSPRTWSRNW
jgi:hypothetical protein